MRVPRMRHLRRRSLGRTRYQDDVLEFVSERATTLSQYADESAVWDAIRADGSTRVAAETSAA